MPSAPVAHPVALSRPAFRFSFSLRLSLVTAAAALTLAACGGGGGQAGPGGPGGGMPPSPVSAMQVSLATLPATYEYVGQAAGSREVEVRARTSGILLKRNFREGTSVSRGQSLYSLDPAPLKAVLDRADADVASAEARLGQATRTQARLKPLYEAKAVSQKDFDDATSAEAIARADLKGAQARRAEAALNLGYTRVEAPIGGVIGRSQVSEGTLVSGPAVLLTSITQTDPALIRFGIADTDQMRWRQEAEAGRLVLPKGGAFDVEVVLADGTVLKRKGKLQFTDARVSATTGTNEAQAEVPNADGLLKPGQFVRVRLQGATRPAAVKVPTRAVLEGPQGKFVYVVEDNKAQARPVQVGEQMGDQWLVNGGLKQGESVIVDGVMRIGPGAPVQVAAPAAAASAPCKRCIRPRQAGVQVSRERTHVLPLLY
jgi:membrane fusion protein (multidrug efflux system)